LPLKAGLCDPSIVSVFKVMKGLRGLCLERRRTARWSLKSNFVPRRNHLALSWRAALGVVVVKKLPTPENVLSVLPKELYAALFAAARHQHLKADQTLFTAGDPGDGCYRVEAGVLKVTVVSASGRERILAILGPGALVGELAMIDAQPRSASVVAAR